MAKQTKSTKKSTKATTTSSLFYSISYLYAQCVDNAKKIIVSSHSDRNYMNHVNDTMF